MRRGYKSGECKDGEGGVQGSTFEEAGKGMREISGVQPSGNCTREYSCQADKKGKTTVNVAISSQITSGSIRAE